MTEAEWLACRDPEQMLAFLKRGGSDRKRQLFNVACCRRVWHLLADEESRRAVQVLEKHLEGQASKAELQTAHREARSACSAIRRISNAATYCAALVPENATFESTPFSTAQSQSVANVTTMARAATGTDAMAHPMPYDKAIKTAEQAALSHLLRCIFNPFRRASIGAAWLAWNDGAIRKMAQVIYDARSFDRLPLLADALEDAGCTDADLLAHCRGPGPHVRGCWVVDLLLGKA